MNSIAPLIIIGAPRSGTKMLRELIKIHPDVTGALHEEENIWSFGNPSRKSKSLQKENVSDEIGEHIRNHYANVIKKSNKKYVVAKNVSNSLRISFVREIFPDSPIVNIIRDGRDAVYSAEKRWVEPSDIKYLIKNKVFKEKNFPVKDIPYFLMRHLKWMLQKKKQQKQQKQHLNWWGPKFDDSEELSNTHSLIELCGIQWVRCTETALNDLDRLEGNSYLNIHYEDLVTSTESKMQEVYEFLGLSYSEALADACKEYVIPVGEKGWESIESTTKHKELMDVISPTLSRTGYI